MTTFERIKELAKKQHISIKKLSTDLGFGESTIYKWKEQEPKGKDLAKVADRFHVSTDYLLGRTDTPQFTRKDERDVQKILTDMTEGLSNDSSLAYMKNGGEEIDEEINTTDLQLRRIFFNLFFTPSLSFIFNSKVFNQRNNEFISSRRRLPTS